LPKENPGQADGRLKSLEGTDRNACASHDWKGGNMELAFLDSTVLVTVLFYSRFPVVVVYPVLPIVPHLFAADFGTILQ